MIPRPTEVTQLAELTSPLDAADHPTRLGWVRSLNARQQYRLFELAKGNPVAVADLVAAPGETVRHHGRNGLALFNKFEKRFARLPEGVGGYNHSVVPGWIAPVLRIVTGPGHFVAVDSPEVPGEVWIDYRSIPTEQAPGFPPLRDNEHGLPALVFGDMVDVLRRVSRHVYVGDSFKNRYPRPSRPPLLARVGGWLPTAPFVICRE